jgi:flagellin-like hook-associated protein FlgL
MSNCDAVTNPKVAYTLASIKSKQHIIGNLQSNLVEGRKSIKTTSPADLASGRTAELKALNYSVGSSNIERAIDVLDIAIKCANKSICTLSELRNMATVATGPMSDLTRVAEHQPQFQAMLDTYNTILEHQKIDSMPLFKGSFNCSFLTSSTGGDTQSETIDLRKFDFSPLAFGFENDLSGKSVNVITEAADQIYHQLRDILPLGSKERVLGVLENIEVDTGKLIDITKDLKGQLMEPALEPGMKAGNSPAHSDDMLHVTDSLYHALENWKNEFMKITEPKEWLDFYAEVHVELDADGNVDNIDGTIDETVRTGDDISQSPNMANKNAAKEAAKAIKGLTDNWDTSVNPLLNKFNETFSYDAKISVSTEEKAKVAEHKINQALEEVDNAITVIHGKMDSLNKILCLNEDNALLQTKIANRHLSVDPIEISTEISKNSRELERAMCSLQGTLALESSISQYLSDCTVRCA